MTHAFTLPAVTLAAVAVTTELTVVVTEAVVMTSPELAAFLELTAKMVISTINKVTDDTVVVKRVSV